MLWAIASCGLSIASVDTRLEGSAVLGNMAPARICRRPTQCFLESAPVKSRKSHNEPKEA